MQNSINNTRTKQRSLFITLLDLKTAFGEVHHYLVQEVLSYHHIPKHAKTITVSLNWLSNVYINLDIDGTKIKQVEKFEYLGSLVTSDAKSNQEIKLRIGIAKTAFKGMSNVLTARDIIKPS